ncbi:MAG TPA: TIGR03759 family integrating conjugative element protein [Methylophaga aminisulfidivorans]|uniref:TIGR03759 family integrating conjugative element protein n=2 Tax=root TaxID=1 RepID=A0A7C1W038_9GAMM|nr:TIGR03759 family integrating conjugative element protein [Methylophaga sp.]HEC74264.1 TIGR03759 family integrating conjugative element protein [Methylophaga aminisulfidivorans]
MNLRFKNHVLLVLILAANTSLAADKITSKETQSKAIDSSEYQTEQKHLMWGLSAAEYSRYEELMKGIRGSISPETISPIEVLGIHAQNDAERRKYARLWADMMEKDAERVLAFQRAYDQAWRDKGDKPLIDITQLKTQSPSVIPTTTTQSSGLPANNLIIATKLDGCAACDKKIQQLLTSMLVDKTLHLDVYFSDSSDKPNSVIRQWAISNRVDAEMLKSRRLTLNHGQSLINQYQLDEKQLPATFKVDNNGGVKRVE